MGDAIYIRSRGKIDGPFTPDELRQLRRRGRFAEFHEISADRRTWQPATVLTELFAPPPPAPPAAGTADDEIAIPIRRKKPPAGPTTDDDPRVTVGYIFAALSICPGVGLLGILVGASNLARPRTRHGVAQVAISIILSGVGLYLLAKIVAGPYDRGGFDFHFPD